MIQASFWRVDGSGESFYGNHSATEKLRDIIYPQNKKINKLPQSNFGRIKAKEIKNRILVYNRTKKKPLL